jgi:large subunit ribosomal protein L13
MIKTYMQKSSAVQREWHLVDLEGKTLGRIATDLARLLMGKHRPTYSPHIDSGDYVVVVNASKLVLSGNKLTDKTYSRHSGRPGGFTAVTAGTLMDKDPRKVVEHAVKGMLPKNKLQTPRLRRLKVYSGEEHPHSNHFENKDTK